MKSTDKYWISIYNILENDCTIVLAHPKYVKATRGKKTDRKSAKRLPLYHILKNGENYNAELKRKFEMPPSGREIAVRQTVIIARVQDYKIKPAAAWP